MGFIIFSRPSIYRNTAASAQIFILLPALPGPGQYLLSLLALPRRPKVLDIGHRTHGCLFHTVESLGFGAVGFAEWTDERGNRRAQSRELERWDDPLVPVLP